MQRWTYPSVQSCAASLVLGVWQGTLLQQEVDTVSVTSQNSEHQRGPENDKDVFYFTVCSLVKADKLKSRFLKKNSLAKFVCDVGEIPLLPVIDHHAQAVRVTVGSWCENSEN